MRWPRLLTYGNWGGPGWSGGEYVADRRLTRWNVKPVDEMDAAFREHDLMYQQRAIPNSLADEMLVAALKRTNVQGVWSNIYRIGAIIGFSIKSFFSRG